MSLRAVQDELLQMTFGFLGLHVLLPVSLVSRRFRMAVKLSIQRKDSALSDARELLFVKQVNMFFYGVRNVPGRNIFHCKDLVLPTAIPTARLNAPFYAVHFLFDFPCLRTICIQLSTNDLHILSHVLKSRQVGSSSQDVDKNMPPQLEIVLEDRCHHGISLVQSSSFATADPFQFDHWLRLLEIVMEHEHDVQKVSLRLFPTKKVQTLLTALSSATGASFQPLVKTMFHLEDVFEFEGAKEPETFWVSLLSTFASLRSMILTSTSAKGAGTSFRSAHVLDASNSCSSVSLMHSENVSTCFGMSGDSFLFSIPVFLFRSTCPMQRKLFEFLRTKMSISSVVVSLHPTAMQDEVTPRAVAQSFGGPHVVHIRNLHELWRCPANSLVCSSLRKSDLEAMSLSKVPGAWTRLAELERNGCRLALLEYSIESDCGTSADVGRLVANALAPFVESRLLNERGFFILTRSNWTRRLLNDEAKRRDFAASLCYASSQRLATRSGTFSVVANMRFDSKIDYVSYLFFCEVTPISRDTEPYTMELEVV